MIYYVRDTTIKMVVSPDWSSTPYFFGFRGFGSSDRFCRGFDFFFCSNSESENEQENINLIFSESIRMGIKFTNQSRK